MKCIAIFGRNDVIHCSTTLPLLYSFKPHHPHTFVISFVFVPLVEDVKELGGVVNDFHSL